MNRLLTGAWKRPSMGGEDEDFLDFAPILKMHHIELKTFRKIVNVDREHYNHFRIRQADLDRLRQLKAGASPDEGSNGARSVGQAQRSSDGSSEVNPGI